MNFYSSKVIAETIHFIENVNLKAQLINNKTYKEFFLKNLTFFYGKFDILMELTRFHISATYISLTCFPGFI